MEMAATEEMTAIALEAKPHAACLVPERREERTTEGGLDVLSQEATLAPVVAALGDAGIRVSLFIGAERPQIAAAARLSAPAIEIHTGGWCDAVTEGRDKDAEREWQAIADGARYADSLGLEVHAGHGLDYDTAKKISTLPEIVELNIGHFLIGEAVFIGLAEAIRRMRAAMDKGREAVRLREGDSVA